MAYRTFQDKVDDFRVMATSYGLRFFPCYSLIKNRSIKKCSDLYVCDCGLGYKCTSPGKHPKIRASWVKAASKDISRIDSWEDELERTNENANWAVNTGYFFDPTTNKKRYLVVIDVDTIDHELIKLLPKTFGYYTGKGAHYWYFYDKEIDSSIGTIAKNVDVKSKGGYVIVPPSKHKSGKRYKFFKEGTTKVSDLPEEVFEYARNQIKLRESIRSINKPKDISKLIEEGKHCYDLEYEDNNEEDIKSFDYRETSWFKTIRKSKTKITYEDVIRAAAKPIKKERTGKVVLNKKKSARQIRKMIKEGWKMPEGERNDNLFVLTCSYRFYNPNKTQEEVYEYIKSIRDKHCENPRSMPNNEVDNIVSSAFKYTLSKNAGACYGPPRLRELKEFPASARMFLLSLSPEVHIKNMKCDHSHKLNDFYEEYKKFCESNNIEHQEITYPRQQLSKFLKETLNIPISRHPIKGLLYYYSFSEQLSEEVKQEALSYDLPPEENVVKTTNIEEIKVVDKKNETNDNVLGYTNEEEYMGKKMAFALTDRFDGEYPWFKGEQVYIEDIENMPGHVIVTTVLGNKLDNVYFGYHEDNFHVSSEEHFFLKCGTGMCLSDFMKSYHGKWVLPEEMVKDLYSEIPEQDVIRKYGNK